VEVIDLLLDAGAPAGDVYAAARLGLTGELSALLVSGGDPNAAGPYGETALAAALARGRAEAAEMLRQAGARED
jgi:ankyrin repeat protein